MPTFEITSPEGRKFRITAPDGATKEQALAYAQSQQAPASPSFANVQGGSDTVRASDDSPSANDSDFARLITGKPRAEPEGYWSERMGELRDIAGKTGVRQVMQGVGGVADMLGGAAFNRYIGAPLGLTNENSVRDNMAGLADQAGLPRPSTPGERIASDVGEALTGTGLTMGIGGGINALAGAGRSGVNRLGQLLTAQAPTQVVSTITGAGAASAARESGASPGTQALAGLAGGLAPGAAAATGAATARGLVRGRSGENMLANIRDFESLGAIPSLGQASGNRTLQGVENLLAGGPTSSGVMHRFAERQAGDIGEGLQDLAENVSRNASGERAGRAIERGIRGFRDQFKTTQAALYDKLDSFIPGNQRIDVSQTRDAIKQLNAPIPGAPNTSRLFQNSRIAGIGSALEKDLSVPTDAHLALDSALSKLDELYASRASATQDAGRFASFANDQANRIDQFFPVPGQPRISGRYSPAVQRAREGTEAAAEAVGIARNRVSQAGQIESALGDLQAAVDATGGKLPYEAIKKLRTLVGQELDDAGLMSDFPRSKFTALYRALSNDLEGAARTTGPEASQAWLRANNFTKAGMDRMEALQRVIDKNGGPERVYNAAMSGTRDGGTTLRAVMQSLPTEGQKAVTAAVIKRMGLANPGAQDAAGEAFSAQTFLTNWNKVSPEAKRALFDRYGPSFSADMDRIANVAQNIRDGAKVFANPSGTANRAAALTYGASLVASLFDPSLVSTGFLVASGAGANISARVLINPRVVKALAQSTALPVGAAPSLAQTFRLIAEHEGDPEIAELANYALEVARKESNGQNQSHN